jgi:hypothetical protein
MPRRNSRKEYVFEDYPEFTPNLSPQEVFAMGSFGGTYWRPIHSSVTNKNYKNLHKKYPNSWWKNIPDTWLVAPWDQYDKTINTYGVYVGTTLEFWEDKDWITSYNPYGWMHWYCDFFLGKRTPDDERQVLRWLNFIKRFRLWLVNQIKDKNGKWNDHTISPKIRQSLQHWGYKLSKHDYDKYF